MIFQNKILRLTEDILSRPQLITPEAYSVITDYLYSRNDGLLIKPELSTDGNGRQANYDVKAGVGVIDIAGSLSAKPVQTLCGEVGTSYQAVLDQTEEMLAAGIKTIVMNVSSGGGEAYNCFYSVQAFRNMVDEAGATVYGFADGIAASAAYAWFCACDEAYAHPDAETGSIGVVCAIMDNSKQLEQNGLKRIYVHAGESKVPYAADGSIRPEFIADLQYKIDSLYENFVAHVETYTGLSADAIKATEAKTFLSKDAVKLGLIDGIFTEQEFQDYVSTKLKGA
jgi:ClpP class serine protease